MHVQWAGLVSQMKYNFLTLPTPSPLRLTVDQIADVIVFLSSPMSRYVNGVDLSVDG